MQRKMMVPYFVIMLVFFSFMMFGGCGGGSGGGQSESFWSDNTVTKPQIYGVSNLNSTGQPVRIGDWCQINGASFGSSKGNGYVHFTLQDGTTGNADLIYLWSDSQIVCRVPQSKSKKRMHVHVKAAAAAVSISVYTNDGTGSNSYPVEYDSSPNPTPQPTPPSPSPHSICFANAVANFKHIAITVAHSQYLSITVAYSHNISITVACSHLVGYGRRNRRRSAVPQPLHVIDRNCICEL